MGEVYLAEDLSLKRQVALKVLPAAFARDPERLARFEREAEAVAALNHPNIVTIHSVNEAGGVRFLTMELVEGQALDRLIPKGGIKAGDLLALADAIAAAHERGITHRDLKPANIMVDGGGGINIWRVPMSDGAPAGPPEQVTTGAGNDLQLAVAPGANRLAFTVLQQNADIWRLPVDPKTGAATGPPEPLVSTTREDSRPAWSPDGTQIAFNSDRTGDMNLWVKNLADGTERQITRGAGGGYQPHWSPDGRTLVFFSSRSGSADIWSVDIQDGTLRQLTSSPGLDINPAFSPDGRRIAFHSDRSGRTDVWLMEAGGSNQRQVGSTGVGGHFVAWTDDGRSVFYRDGSYFQGMVTRLTIETGVTEQFPGVNAGGRISFSPDTTRIMDVTEHKLLWAFTLDGSRLKVFEFPHSDVRIDYPRWSPDGRWVAFDRNDPRGGDIWVLEGAEK